MQKSYNTEKKSGDWGGLLFICEKKLNKLLHMFGLMLTPSDN